MNTVKLAPLLLIFVEVAKQKSFTKAAKKLGLSKSAVSLQIKRLEHDVKMQLLARNTRGVVLTGSGEALFKRSESLSGQIYHVVQDIQQVKAQPSGRFKVSVPPFFEQNMVVPALKQLLLEYPLIEPELVVTGSWVDLIEHQLDVAIFGGKMRDCEYKAQSIGRIHDVFTVSPGYLKQHADIGSLQDLIKGDHKLIATPWQSGRIKLFENGKAIEHVLPHTMFTNSLVTLVDMVEQDMGIALLPHSIIKKKILSGQLTHTFKHNFVQILPEITGQAWHFYFIHRYHANKPPHVSRFYELINFYFSAASEDLV
ncbi:LysR family transcriptional regulator [Pseudoalteromonas sp. MSK9-3]|uniref:LysR family transcriptional regulator n=1 Tax=Pseudoalteromonas sp. MSK9-3 TaxID=1897633 RepID=UPI000E6D3E4A|nr:LysR family transcriptional regulator [Pseudoalteromonas sp. MSK9-3]RJE78301.1 LysR family transcriptional regulator [Pseudoalteromonas sp. MSK9-3]